MLQLGISCSSCPDVAVQIFQCPLQPETTSSPLPSPSLCLRLSLLAVPQLRHSGSQLQDGLEYCREGLRVLSWQKSSPIHEWLLKKGCLIPHIRTSGIAQNSPSQSSQLHVPLSPTGKKKPRASRASPSQLSMFSHFFYFPFF